MKQFLGCSGPLDIYEGSRLLTGNHVEGTVKQLTSSDREGARMKEHGLLCTSSVALGVRIGGCWQVSDYSTMIYIPRDKAYQCLDCGGIGNQSTSCPACASTHLQGIAGVLDRVTDAEERRLLHRPC